MSAPAADGAGYCFDLVREADKDRFLAALFAPDDKRRLLLALYAFNVEVSRIREVVREPMLGEIRLQWWADAVSRAYGGQGPEHPVMAELMPAIGERIIPEMALANLVEARRFDLYDDPMPSLNDLEGYLGETSSALIQMAALILAGRQAQVCAEAAGLAGVAYGMSGLLRLLPMHRARGQCFLPEDVLARHGLKPAHVLSGRWDEPMRAALSDMVSLGRQRLEEARALSGTIPAAALPAFLPASLTGLALDAVTRRGRNPLKQVTELSQLRRQWSLWRAARRGRF
ncbi:phytoene/squalene synthase family protein [Rhodoligotrophos defluvii]|uniref:phytoene/squalene synthase family protein n=1 Tax=Rhodoligotrophos defluvii TaxID=2561934 RepID=UPI0010C98457|nr:phytoene/squalene synthase family protein [Rhodoligotrophos defluvii]